MNFKQLQDQLNTNQSGDGLKVNRSNSEATYYQQQIPKYDSSTLNTNHSSMLSKIGSRSFKLPTSSSINPSHLNVSGSGSGSKYGKGAKTNSMISTNTTHTTDPEHALSAPSGSALAFLNHSKNPSSGAHSDAVMIKGGPLSQGNSISPAVANAPDLPDSPQELQAHQKNIIKPSASRDLDIDGDEMKHNHNGNNKTMIVHPDPISDPEPAREHIADQDSDPNLLDSEKASECDYGDDAYDLNSEEGDDIKLRRAAIQSQRAVASALLPNLDPMVAPKSMPELNRDRDADDEEEEPMDGAPIIQSIYDTLNKRPTKSAPPKQRECDKICRSRIRNHSEEPSTSIEDMFNDHPDGGDQSSNPNDTNGTGTVNHEIQTTPDSVDSPLRNVDIIDGPDVGAPSELAGVSTGPSIPSLATEITNRYSEVTNKTGLTSITQRLCLQSESGKVGIKPLNMNMNMNINGITNPYVLSNKFMNNKSYSSMKRNSESQSSKDSDSSMDHLSSGDESTCITQPAVHVPIPPLHPLPPSTMLKMSNSMSMNQQHGIGINFGSALSLVHTMSQQQHRTNYNKKKETKFDKHNHERKISEDTSSFDSSTTGDLALHPPSYEIQLSHSGKDGLGNNGNINGNANDRNPLFPHRHSLDTLTTMDDDELMPPKHKPKLFNNNRSDNSMLGRIKRAISFGNSTENNHRSKHSLVMSKRVGTKYTNSNLGSNSDGTLDTDPDEDDDENIDMNMTIKGRTRETIRERRGSDTDVTVTSYPATNHFNETQTSITTLDTNGSLSTLNDKTMHKTATKLKMKGSSSGNSKNARKRSSTFHAKSSAVPDRTPRFISEKSNDKTDKIVNKMKRTANKAKRKIKNSISNYADTNGDNSDNDVTNKYYWIKRTLRQCDVNGWEKYYDNFKNHKVDETRLTKLDDGDWRELIPAIGPRNDFKEAWEIRQIDNDFENMLND